MSKILRKRFYRGCDACEDAGWARIEPARFRCGWIHGERKIRVGGGVWEGGVEAVEFEVDWVLRLWHFLRDEDGNEEVMMREVMWGEVMRWVFLVSEWWGWRWRKRVWSHSAFIDWRGGLFINDRDDRLHKISWHSEHAQPWWIIWSLVMGNDSVVYVCWTMVKTDHRVQCWIQYVRIAYCFTTELISQEI